MWLERPKTQNNQANKQRTLEAKGMFWRYVIKLPNETEYKGTACNLVIQESEAGGQCL